MMEDFKSEVEKIKEQYPEFFEKVDPELLKFITSEKFLFDVAQICLDNGITDEEQTEKITYRVALALFGEVPKENLAQILELGAGLDPQTAKAMHLEFNRLIFSQLKEPKKRPEVKMEFSPGLLEETEIESEKPKRKDIYHEQIQ
ncbi:MAG: hypothetical protein AAB565_01200 [Patescibacteria group bacterium]